MGVILQERRHLDRGIMPSFDRCQNEPQLGPIRRPGRPVYEWQTISNCLKIFGETFRCVPRHPAGGLDMTVQNHAEKRKLDIARYRRLEREVTDPLAICLLRLIAEELESDLNDARGRVPHGSQGRSPHEAPLAD